MVSPRTCAHGGMQEKLEREGDFSHLPQCGGVNVKLRTELYNNALKEHEEKFGDEKVQQWKEALKGVARIRGWDINDRAKWRSS